MSGGWPRDVSRTAVWIERTGAGSDSSRTTTPGMRAGQGQPRDQRDLETGGEEALGGGVVLAVDRELRAEAVYRFKTRTRGLSWCFFGFAMRLDGTR